MRTRLRTRRSIKGKPTIFARPIAVRNSSPTRSVISAREQKRPRRCRRSRCPKARSTPARCIRKSGRSDRAPARICGMALEPDSAGEETGPSGELADMTRRFWVSAPRWPLPLLMLEMGAHFRACAFPHVSPQVSCSSSWRHAGRAVGRLAVLRARRAIAAHAPLNMFTLIALGIGVAYSTAWWRRWRPDCFRRRFATRTAALRSISRPPPIITVLVLLGQVLELRARASTLSAIRALMTLTPNSARRIRGGRQRRGRAARRRRGRRLDPRSPRRTGAGRRRPGRGR